MWFGNTRLAEELVKGANEAGLDQVRFFNDSDEAAAAIIGELKYGTWC